MAGWIESELAALRYFALNGPDHRTHDEQNAAVAAYIRWRNAHPAPPKPPEESAGPLPVQNHPHGGPSALRRHSETGMTSVSTKSTAPSRR